MESSKYYSELCTNETGSTVKTQEKYFHSNKVTKKQIDQSMSCHRIIKPWNEAGSVRQVWQRWNTFGSRPLNMYCCTSKPRNNWV